jgi:hypothetical protein
MKRKALVFSVLIIMVLPLLFSIGCPVDIVGSGNLVTEQKDFSDFVRVDAGSAFDVSITRDDNFSIKITADDNLMEHVRVSISGDTLHIDTNAISFANVTLRAAITMPDIDVFNLSGASRGTLTGFDAAETFSCDLSGASRLSFTDITFGDVTASASGASTIDGTLTCGNIGFDLSGASNVGVEGQAADVTLDGSGASSAALDDFTVENANVELSGASSAVVKATGTIDADLSGASSLDYTGTLGEVHTSGASSIVMIQ